MRLRCDELIDRVACSETQRDHLELYGYRVSFLHPADNKATKLTFVPVRTEYYWILLNTFKAEFNG